MLARSPRRKYTILRQGIRLSSRVLGLAAIEIYRTPRDRRRMAERTVVTCLNGVGRTVGISTAVAVSLLTFPSATPWMVGLWLSWHTWLRTGTRACPTTRSRADFRYAHPQARAVGSARAPGNVAGQEVASERRRTAPQRARESGTGRGGASGLCPAVRAGDSNRSEELSQRRKGARQKRGIGMTLGTLAKAPGRKGKRQENPAPSPLSSSRLGGFARVLSLPLFPVCALAPLRESLPAP